MLKSLAEIVEQIILYVVAVVEVQSVDLPRKQAFLRIYQIPGFSSNQGK